VLMAGLVIRTVFCIVPIMWLSDPQTKRIPGWPSPRSAPPQWFCGYPARCRSVVLGNVAHSERGSRNLPIKSWEAKNCPMVTSCICNTSCHLGSIFLTNQSPMVTAGSTKSSALRTPIPSLRPCAILFLRSTKKSNSRPNLSSSSVSA